MLTMSNGPGEASFDSGTTIGASTRNTPRTGTAIRNTEPHQKCSSRKPPTIGPSAAPPEKAAAQMAMASRRWLRSAKMLRSNDNVEGISMIPSSAREAMRASAVGA